MKPFANKPVSQVSQYTLQEKGDENAVLFHSSHKIELIPSAVFLYKNNQTIANAYPSEQGLSILIDIPVYEQLGTSVELSAVVSTGIEWTTHQGVYSDAKTRVRVARFIHNCSSIQATYDRLLSTEQSVTKNHQLPSLEHREALQIFLSVLLITTLENPSCPLMESFKIDFAHSIRYHPPLYEYLNLAHPIVELIQPSTTIQDLRAVD